MRRRQPTPSSSSSSDSDGSDIESCFDIEDGHNDTDTEATDADTDIEAGDYNEEDLSDLEWIAGEDNVYPPEYYLNQDESEDEDEDYSDSSNNLLGMIEDQFHRCVPHSLFVCRLLLLNR
jgi:hypothetical protein